MLNSLSTCIGHQFIHQYACISMIDVELRFSCFKLVVSIRGYRQIAVLWTACL